jgi:hypothetical protein
LQRHVSSDLEGVLKQKQILEECVKDRDLKVKNLAAQVMALESDLSLERDRNSIMRREAEIVDEV